MHTSCISEHVHSSNAAAPAASPLKKQADQEQGFPPRKPCPSSFRHRSPRCLAWGPLFPLISICVTAFSTTSNFYFCFSLRGKSTPCWLSHLPVMLVTEDGRIRVRDSRRIPQNINANLGKVSWKKFYIELKQG